jgi:hypothetical protein
LPTTPFGIVAEIIGAGFTWILTDFVFDVPGTAATATSSIELVNDAGAV